MILRHVPQFITLVAIYSIYGTTFTLAGGMKFLEGKVPDWFTNQFSKTFLARFPGIPAAYWSIALLEISIPILLIISVFRMEYVRGIDPVFLSTAVGMAAIVFGMLGFGLRLVNDFQGAANSFFYFAAALVTQAYIQFTFRT